MANPKVSAWVRDHADEILHSLQELIRHGGPCNPEPAAGPGNAQDWVESEVRRLGLETSRFTPDLQGLTSHPGFNDVGFTYADRPVIIGRAPGLGGGRSLVLNAHADIVGAGDHARWTHPPFAAERVGDLIYGRGSSDDKAPLIALLFGLACARAVAGGLRGDVTFMSVADEEGAGMCTLDALRRGYTADAAIVGEPTGLAIAPSNRGACSFKLEVFGKEAHSGTAFLGVNAILKTMKYAEAIMQLQADLDRERPHPLYASLPVAHCFNIAKIEAGQWVGVVPGKCTMEVMAGAIPGESIEQLRGWVEERINAVTESDDWLREHPPVLTWTNFKIESGYTPLDHPFVQAARKAGREVLGREPELLPLLGGSDMRFFTNYFDIPTLHIGPGDMLAGHTYDESVSVEAVLKGTEIVANLILDWCN